MQGYLVRMAEVRGFKSHFWRESFRVTGLKIKTRFIHAVRREQEECKTDF